jgi:hypothetical protein
MITGAFVTAPADRPRPTTAPTWIGKFPAARTRASYPKDELSMEAIEELL